MSQEISDLVDEPELIDAADDITIDRWTKYGHDRLYINGGRVEPYIDLEDGSLGDTGMVPVDVEFDGDTVTVEIGDEDGHSRHDVVVISLSGDVDDDDEESEGEHDADTNDDDGLRPVDLDELEKGDEVRRVDDPEGQTREVIKEPEENPLAGGVVKVEVQHGTINSNNVEKWRLVE